MLIDDWPAEQPLRAQDEVKRFTNRRLTNVVAAHQERVAAEVNLSRTYTSEIIDGQSAHPHQPGSRASLNTRLRKCRVALSRAFTVMLLSTEIGCGVKARSPI